MILRYFHVDIRGYVTIVFCQYTEPYIPYFVQVSASTSVGTGGSVGTLLFSQEGSKYRKSPKKITEQLFLLIFVLVAF